MASWQILTALLVAAVSVADARSRIIGGSPTSITSYPSIVQVEFHIADTFWSQECAGSILNSVYILSAAHCFAGSDYLPANRRIRAGTSARGNGGAIVQVAQEFNHPSYGQNGNDGDITVVRLASALTLSETIAQASLMAPGFVLPTGWTVTYAGWGLTDVDSADYSSTLQAVSTTVVDIAVCRQKYSTLGSNPPVTSNMICAGNVDYGNQDACAGDAGGALYYNNILTGVISWGNGCGLSDFPGVSTQVSSYTSWIIETAV